MQGIGRIGKGDRRVREILFKAKRKDNGEWVEGYYRADPDLDMHYICGWNYYPSENGLEREPFEYEINPETLCQYIGLKDKNGKKIWENDIVLLREEIQDYEWKAMVKFGNQNWEYNWGWKLVPIGECDMDKDILLQIDMEIATCEVVGNIFDNPELLEVE